MRRLFLIATAACAAFALSVSCSKDDNGNNENGGGETTNPIEANVVGTYSGTLGVSVSGGTPTTQTQNISIAMSANSTDAIDLEVTDFSFSGFELGTITLTNLTVTESEGTYSFATDEAQSITVGEGDSAMTCSIKAAGTVNNGKVTLNLDITAQITETFSLPVSVTFTGDRAAN